MAQGRAFKFEDVMVVATGSNPSGDWSGPQQLLEHMTGRPMWSHDVPSALAACQDQLREQVPDLSIYKPDDRVMISPIPGGVTFGCDRGV